MAEYRGSRMRLIQACRSGLSREIDGENYGRIEQYLLDLASGGARPPKRGRGFDWGRVAQEAGVSIELLARVRKRLQPVLESYAMLHVPSRRDAGCTIDAVSILGARKRGPKPTPPVLRPVASSAEWRDPEGFRAALDLHMRRHGDTCYGLQKALLAQGVRISTSTLAMWRRGGKAPQSADSLAIFRHLEDRYQLPHGYFASKRQREPKAVRRAPIKGVKPAEMRRLTWHLPDDFADRSASEQAEILDWVRRVIVRGSTEYRAYQAEAIRHRFGLQFDFPGAKARVSRSGGKHARTRWAPQGLNREMEALVAFKREVLTAPGYRRSGVWGQETAEQRTEHLGLLFGALTAAPDSAVSGLGLAADQLSFALLVFPSVWDWYVRWRERKRGFFTRWEVDLLVMGAALTRRDTGWIRQTPSLQDRLCSVDGLVTDTHASAAKADWNAACDRVHAHCIARAREIERVARVHRDPFEPILPVLEADNPLAEYRKITDEILRRMPDERRHPKPAAEAVRAFLMLRFGLHTGLRQRNLRELMLCAPGETPRSERWLTEHRRGELRWNARDGVWEVYIPAAAFKNAGSSFFGSRPFRLELPDLAELKTHIDAYVARHRGVLLGRAQDPGTFFVKSVKNTSRSAEYDQTKFYECWRLAIQRYGIFNPYTGKGAIAGLLPHGPHNVRDVLATHILKQTGSYEQASYAIQDTPDMVAQHYGRFLPQDKASLVAKVLNKAWA